MIVLTRSKNILHIISRFVFICIYIFLIANIFIGFDIEYNTLTYIVFALSIAEVIIMIFNDSVSNSGLVMVFFGYTLLVHNGFVIAYMFDSSYKTFQSVTSMSFLANNYYSEAIIIANVIIASFVLILEFKRSGYISMADYSSINNDQGVDNYNNKSVGLVGCFFLLIGLLYFAYFIFTRNLFLAGYITTLNAVENVPMFQHIVILTSLSIALVMCASRGWYMRIALILFGMITLLQFSIGNRGEVLYALVICFALYSVRYNSIKLKHVLIAGVLAIILIPLVRVSRNLQLDAYTISPLKSLLEVFAEEGIEISPFTYIVEYVKVKSGHAYGMTYVNAFADFITRRLHIVNAFAIEKNIIKQIMPYNGMGFSMVAELYYNFGIIISSIVFGIVAVLIRKLEQAYRGNYLSGTRRVFYSLLMVEMVNLTRNDSSTLPLYLIYIIFFMLIFKFVSKKMKSI